MELFEDDNEVYENPSPKEIQRVGRKIRWAIGMSIPGEKDADTCGNIYIGNADYVMHSDLGPSSLGGFSSSKEGKLYRVEVGTDYDDWMQTIRTPKDFNELLKINRYFRKFDKYFYTPVSNKIIDHLKDFCEMIFMDIDDYKKEITSIPKVKLKLSKKQPMPKRNNFRDFLDKLDKNAYDEYNKRMNQILQNPSHGD